MDLKFGYKDIPKCDSCNPDDGSWPGFLTDLSSRSTEDIRRELDQGRGLTDDELLVELQKRVDGKATPSRKYVSVCGVGTGFSVGGDYRYPAFPGNSAFAWEGIENGRWDSISRYWGNTSLSCSNWASSGLRPHDTAIVNGQTVRAHYQSKYYDTPFPTNVEIWMACESFIDVLLSAKKKTAEHVFEGQLIGDFFTEWLDKGRIVNQDPAPTNPQPKMDCDDTEELILTVNRALFPWTAGTRSVRFLDLMLAQLGNYAHLDRLTIMKARPNRMKGSMFTGSQPTDLDEYRRMTPDQQLAHTKDMGKWTIHSQICLCRLGNVHNIG
jgi:chitinase